MSKSRPGGGRYRRSQSSPGPAYAVEPDLRHLRREAPPITRVVRRTALSFGGACAFVAFGAATAQASESNLLDSVTGVVDKAATPVEDVVQSVADATSGSPQAASGGTEPPGDSAAAEQNPAPAPEAAPAEPKPSAQPTATGSAMGSSKPVPAPKPASGAAETPAEPSESAPEPAHEPEPAATDVAPDDQPEPSAVPETGTGPGSASAATSESDDPAVDAEPESLLGDLVSDVTTTAKPLGSLTDVARQIVRFEQPAESDAASSTSDEPVPDGSLDDTGAEPEPVPAGGDGADAPDDDPDASAADLAEASDAEESALGAVGELLHAVTPEIVAGQDEQTKNLVDDASSTVTPVLTAVTGPADHVVITVEPLLATVAAPVNDVLESTVAPGLSTVTEPTGAIVETVVSPADGVADVPALAGVTDQVAGLLSPVTEPAGAVVEPVGTLLAPVTTAVAPVLEPVTTTVAPALAPVTEVAGTLTAPLTPVLDPVLTAVSPVLGPVIETLEPITTVLAPVTAPLLNVLEPVADVLDPVAKPLLDPLVDEAHDPVLVNPGLAPTGNGTAWGLPASDAVGAAFLPAAAGETPAAIPASLTGLARAGADVSRNIAIATTAGAALIGSGHGVPPAVGSVSAGQGSGGDRTSGPSGDLHAAAVLLVGSMFLRRERCGVAALAESLRQPGVRPD